jgi:uncharacterized protein YaaN involved in tellurite resistance
MAELGHSSDPAQPAGSDTSWVIDPTRTEEIERTVADYVETVVSLDSRDQKYLRTVAAVARLGQREFTAAAAMSSRTLDRRLEVARGLLAGKAPLARQLAELRKIVEELNPVRLEGTRKRSRGGRGLSQRDESARLSEYFERFASSQGRVESILQTIAEGRLALERDNALLGQELVSLATVMETLRENAYLAGRLDESLAARIEIVGRTDPDRADCLRVDLLHAIRSRRQEILTQLAVAMQGYASLQIIEETNRQMARAMADATSTTAAALRSAVMVAQAVAGQRMALEQIEAVDLANGRLLEDRNAPLDRQVAAAHEEVAAAGARVAMLQRAWDEVYAALDRVDALKEQRLRSSQADRRPPSGSSRETGDGAREGDRGIDERAGETS